MKKISLILLVFFTYATPIISQNTDVFTLLTSETKKQSKEDDGSWPDISDWIDSKIQFEFTAETIIISRGEPMAKVGTWHINDKRAEKVNNNGDVINSWDCQSGEDYFDIELWKRANSNGNFYYQLYLYSYTKRIVYNTELILQNKEVSGIREEKELYDNGNIKTIGMLFNGKKIGQWKSFLEDGTLNTLMIYNDDHNSGIIENYYKNGKIFETGKFEGKDKKGEWRAYYENGVLESISNFKDGERTGEWKDYFENGNLYTIENYIDGVESGEWKYYRENGSLESIENYKDGEKHGIEKEYHLDGTLYKVETYEEGYSIEAKYYDENGVEE